MRSYHFPSTPVFNPLREEAAHYLASFGFSENSSASASFHIEARLQPGVDEAYTLDLKKSGGALRVEISGADFRAIAHGFHHLLELMGFGFSFFADSIPATLQLNWPAGKSRIFAKPDFARRGFLPWHNFLNSPTTWNPADWRRYLLTLWRMRVNLLIIHNYDGEPLAAIPEAKGKSGKSGKSGKRGKWSAGLPFLTSIDAPWGGTPGIKTTDYACGTGKHLKTARPGVWGAANVFAKDPIGQAQAEFADAVAFGKSLGIDTAFGFELHGDPTAPGYPEFLKRRINHILDAYPALATICLWQPEEWGKRGWVAGEASPGLPKLVRKYGRHFKYLEHTPQRFHEGVRLAGLMEKVHGFVRAKRRSVRVALAGWGGDYWMHCGDFWRGLHHALPADVSFAALDNIDPTISPEVSGTIRAVPAGRDIWIIPWIESDGGSMGRSSQWHPQEDLDLFDSLVHSAKTLGYRGLAGIHWQTAGVELAMAHMSARAWSDAKAPADFRLQYAQAFFSPKPSVAARVADILGKLEALGAGWTGTSQQGECSRFAWEPCPVLSDKPLPPALDKALADLWEARADFRNLSHMDLRAPCHADGLLFHYLVQQGRRDAFDILLAQHARFAALKLTTPHARRLLATMDFVIAYEHIKRPLAPWGILQLQQQHLSESRRLGLKPDRHLLSSYRSNIAKVDQHWREVFRAQVARLDAQSDYGNLVNLNIKAYQAWKMFKAALQD